MDIQRPIKMKRSSFFYFAKPRPRLYVCKTQKSFSISNKTGMRLKDEAA